MLILVSLLILCSFCQQSLGGHHAAIRLSTTQRHAARRLSARQGTGLKASNPFDHTWIQEWAAVGDSYASGVGSGKRIGYWCSLYDAAYPSLINNDESLGNRNRKFNNLACAGYTASNVKDKAINTLSSNQDIITLSAGGNDVYFGEIVNACVFRITRYDCPYWLNEFKKSVESDKLKNDLTDMIKAAKSKLAFSNSRVFWTLYSHFFDTTTHDCDSVQWANPAEYSPDLNFTVERREMFNGLVDQLNNKIRDVAHAAGDQVVVVDWEDKIDDLVGKYCEPGVDETLGKGDDRESLAFYEYYSTLDDKLFGNSIEDSTWSMPTDGDTVTAAKAPLGQMGPYQASIAQDLENAMKGNKTMIDKIHYYLPETKDNNDPHALGGLASDKIIRNFHPQSNGHQRIADAVLSALEDEQAKELGQPAATTTAFGCTAPTGISSHPGTRDLCYADKPPPSIAKFNRQTGLIMSTGFCQDHVGQEVGTGDGIKGSKPNDDNGEILMSASHRTDGDCALTKDSKIYISYDDCTGYFQAAIDSCKSYGSSQRTPMSVETEADDHFS